MSVTLIEGAIYRAKIRGRWRLVKFIGRLGPGHFQRRGGGPSYRYKWNEFLDPATLQVKLVKEPRVRKTVDPTK